MPDLPDHIAWAVLGWGLALACYGFWHHAHGQRALRGAIKAHGEAADFYKAAGGLCDEARGIYRKAQLVARGEIAPDDLKPEARH